MFQPEGVSHPKAEFLDVIGTKVSRVFLLAIDSHLYSRILLTHPLSKSGLKLVCNVNIEHRNLKSENSQDYAQRPQRNCTFMNSASVLSAEYGGTQIQTLAKWHCFISGSYFKHFYSLIECVAKYCSVENTCSLCIYSSNRAKCYTCLLFQYMCLINILFLNKHVY